MVTEPGWRTNATFPTAHTTEPGCAVRAAIDTGRLDENRLKRYRKLVREERRNSESVADARTKARAFGRMAKAILKNKARRP